MTATDSGKLIAESDIKVGVGPPGVEETRKWFNQQVPYKNYAGFSKALDEQVRSVVATTKNTFQNRMIAAQQEWAFNYATANGEAQTQEHEDDVSMPETKKVLDGKVARMAEALFEYDPFFEVEGVRQDLGNMQAFVVSAYVRRMLELARFRDFVEPSAKDGQLCNYSAIKVSWDRRFGEQVSRKVELRGELGKSSYWHSERWMRRELVADAPKLELVDPFWLILDIDAGHYDDLAYVGDESEQFLHVLEQKAELGIFDRAQVKKLRDNKEPRDSVDRNGSSANQVDQFRMARQVTLPGGIMDANPSGSSVGAKRIRCVELWMWFDFGSDGFEGVVDPLGRKITGTHKVVITMAGQTVLQFRLNPFDKKFVPYALAVYNRNGHEMVARPPFSHVVVMNAQYDRMMSNIHRNFDLAVAPWLVTGPDSDMGANGPLSQIVPGTIMQNPGPFNQVNIKDVPVSTEFFIGMMRREMEELSGHMRIYEQPQGTATEVERKVQEQQRTVRTDIRVLSEQWRQVCLIIYKMAGQFATEAQQFTVVGKAASVLGKTFSVPPQWLQEEIDFRFLGVDSLHTYGTRSAGLSQWVNQWGAFLPTMPGINLMGLARLDFEYRVGKHAINDVFPDPEPTWQKWSQQEENVMLLSGQHVPISQHDDHQQHAAETANLIRQMRSEPSTPQAALDAAIEHFQLHLVAYQREMEEQAAQQRQADQQAQLLAPAGGQPGVDRPAAAGGMQANEKLAQTPGVTPGPTQARTVSRTGRQGAGTSQSQAQAR